MVNCEINTLHKADELYLISMLKVLEWDSLTEIEMTIYALRGLAGARGLENNTLLDNADYLLNLFDTVRDLIYKGSERNIKRAIKAFKDYVETMETGYYCE